MLFVFTIKVKHRFRFYPDHPQTRALEKLFGSVRWTYNHALAARRDQYRETGKGPSYGDTSALLTQWKIENPFLREVSCVPLQQSLRHLQRAYVNFFEGRARYPAFKSKRDKQSAEFTKSAFNWDQQNGNLSLAKIGRLRIRWSRVIKESPSTVTITKHMAGRYFVTLTTEESRATLPGNTASVGIDLGLKTLAALSNGEKIEPLKPLNNTLGKLRRASRILSRRKKGSGRRTRQRLKVARLHARIADTRKDFLDKTTTDLVRRFGVIAIEDLNVRGIVRNRRLARAIADAGFGELRNMLEYKCLWYGRELRVADRFEPQANAVLVALLTNPSG
jgi:putative transposase